MPQYPPPRRLRTDNIRRVLSQRTTEGLLLALGTLRGRSGQWPENDPEAYAAYLHDLLNDPRLQRTRAEHIPADHPDARSLPCNAADADMPELQRVIGLYVGGLAGIVRRRPQRHATAPVPLGLSEQAGPARGRVPRAS